MAWAKYDGRPPLGTLVEITAGRTTKGSRGHITRYVGRASVEVRCRQYVLVVGPREYRVVKAVGQS